MRRVLVIAVTFWACFAALLGSTVAFARQHPVGSWLSILHLRDCTAPCWIGIEPGKTTLAEARERVYAVYGRSASQSTSYHSPHPGVMIITLHDPNNPAVHAQITLDTHELRDNLPILTITLDSDPFSLGELVTQLGDPQHVNLIGNVGKNTYYLSLNYGDDTNRGIIVVLRSVDRLDWDQRPEWLRLQDLGPTLRGKLQENNSPWFLPWRGFTTLSHYGIP